MARQFEISINLLKGLHGEFMIRIPKHSVRSAETGELLPKEDVVSEPIIIDTRAKAQNREAQDGTRI